MFSRSAHNFHLKKCIYQLFLEFAHRSLNNSLSQNLSQSTISVFNFSESQHQQVILN